MKTLTRDNAVFASLLLLISMISYWLSIFVATFISRGTLRAASEPLLPVSFVLALLAGGLLVWLGVFKGKRLLPPSTDPLKLSQGEGLSTYQLVKAEITTNRSDLRWVLLITGLVFGAFWYIWGTDFAGDGPNFILSYLQLNDRHPLYLVLQLYWPPLTGLFYGGLLDIGGLGLLKIGQLVQALSGSVIFFLTLRPFGRKAAWLGIILWWLCWSNQVYFHLVGGDGMSTWTILLWLGMVRLAVQYQRPSLWFGVGLLAGINMLVRVGNLMLIIGLLPLIFWIPQWRKFFYYTASGLAGLLLVAIPFIVYNGLRYDIYALSMGGNYQLFHTTYIPSIVSAENGAASRQLAQLVEENLLTTPAYEGITLDDIFTQPSHRTMDDMLVVVDMTQGWQTHHALLRQVAREAIRKRPLQYLRNNLHEIVIVLGAKSDLHYPTDVVVSTQVNLFPEIDLTNQKAFPTFMLMQPDSRFPSDTAIQESTDQLEQFISPIRRDDSHIKWVDWLNKLWVRFGISPALWLLSMPAALIFYKGRTRWFLLSLMLAVFAIAAPAAIVNAQMRYRHPLEPLLTLILVVTLTAWLWQTPEHNHL